MSVFDQYRKESWPYEFRCQLTLPCLVGGVPSDQRVVEGWLRSKLMDRKTEIEAMIAETMVERDVDAEAAVQLVAEGQSVNGFKRGPDGLFIEGRQVKACLKEAVSIAADAEKIKPRGFGLNSRKGIKSYVAEHVVVVEDLIPLGAVEPTGIHQRFIHKMTAQGPRSALLYEEYLENATVTFTIRTDHEFTEREWAMIWTTAENQGLGASRSQGFGTFTVTEWDPVEAVKPRTARKKEGVAA